MKPHEPGSQAPGPPPVGGLARLLASLQGFYRRHRELIGAALVLYFVYFTVLVGLPVYFLSIYGLPALIPAPWGSPPLPLLLAKVLGHLRFAFFYTLPLTLPALLLLVHTRITRKHHPSVRPLVWAALLALFLYYLPGLPAFPLVHARTGAHTTPGKSTDAAGKLISARAPSVTKLATLAGARLTTPNLMVTLDISPGALRDFLPALVTLRSIPHTLPAPGPVPEQATLIAAAEVWRANPFDDHFANFFNNPAPLRLSLKHAVAPARNSTHYTEVCSWIGEDGDGWGNKNYWFCHLSDIGPGTDKKGQGYIEVELAGLGGMHQNYYVFQFPKEWADENCREAGGILYNEVDFHSFSGACRGGNPGTVAQIGELKEPEGLVPLTPPPKEPPATP